MEPAAPTPVVKKPLPDGKSEIPLSTFTYMFNEIVRYYQNQAQDTSDIEGGYVTLFLFCYPERAPLSLPSSPCCHSHFRSTTKIAPHRPEHGRASARALLAARR
jgi:hypothetical protein